jgi:3-oxoadipate enol-lactonase
MTGVTVELARIESGPRDAPVLLLGSSLGTTHEMWQPQLALLEQRFRVVRFDHRGHGESPAPPGPYTIGDLGRDVVALLDDLDVAQASYAGLSLGGMVGMWLAATVPDRVERLALLCTSANLASATAWHDRAAGVRAGRLRELAGPIVERWFTAAFAARRPDVVRRFNTLLTSSEPDGYASCCEAIAELDLSGDLSRIIAPTLVVVAADDLAIPAVHGQRIAERIRGARLAVVADAAHLANVEQPDVVGALLLDHLGASVNASRE